MKNFAFFDGATGKCVQICTAPNLENAKTAAIPGQKVVEVDSDFSGREAYLHAGDVLNRPPQPSKAHVFDWAKRVWKDPRLLADLKAEKWEEVKGWRTIAENPLTVTTAAGTFQTDPKSIAKIRQVCIDTREAARVGKDLEFLNWRMADDKLKRITPDDLSEVLAEFAIRGQEARERADKLRYAINSATKAELQRMTWEPINA